ncbi:MAG: carboxypeptidase-like regulatory domain-containing protein [Acidobacteriota bacterium]
MNPAIALACVCLIALPLASAEVAAVYYVTPGTPTGGEDGSKANPFHSIQHAVTAAGSTAATVRVAGGEYTEAITISPGIQLYGGYDRADWKRKSSQVSIVHQTGSGVDFSGASGDEYPPMAVLDRFEIRGDPEVEDAPVDIGSPLGHSTVRATVRDCTIYPSKAPLNPSRDSQAIYGRLCNVKLLSNKILARDGFMERGEAVALYSASGEIRGNQILRFASPLFISYPGDGSLSVSRNTLLGLGGISISNGASPSIVDNSVKLEQYSGGCSYVIHNDASVAASHPVIRGNRFFIGWQGRGICEYGDEADPAELTKNRYYMGSEATYVYWDYDSSADGKIYDIDDLNNLSDIPKIGGNTLARCYSITGIVDDAPEDTVVRITGSGRTESIPADARGYYQFMNLLPGAYVVTPVSSQGEFIPSSAKVQIGKKDIVFNFISK